MSPPPDRAELPGGAVEGLRLSRRHLLSRGMMVVAGAVPAASFLSACGGPGDGMMGGGPDGTMGRRPPDFMMSGDQMMGPEMMEDMRVIHQLLQNHEQIEREVKDIPDGIRSRTTSEDPAVAELIRTHVVQMSQRVEEGDPIRMMDPVFREIFEHHETIQLDARPIEGGILVVETSVDPQVELLIRQHAQRAVSEFVAEGMARAMEPTPLPPGYRSS